MTPFRERAGQMGLNASLENQGLFSYSDQYSEVVYRQLTTMSGIEDHPTNGQILPKLAIFTREANAKEFQHAGYVSELYKFIGNDVLNQRIREAITSVGIPILTENVIPNFLYTKLRTELIIQSSKEVPNVGDVLPVMIVNNSYDGTKAATVNFGIATNYENKRVVFGFSLGEMRQVHIESSSTSMASVITAYMEVFSESISDMIVQSFNSRLTENEMLASLDVIEGFGKKRREDVSKLLQEMMPDVVEGQPVPLPTAWQVFLAIVRYSSFEKNLNIKRLMENAAESVLVIPTKMHDVLSQLPA